MERARVHFKLGNKLRAEGKDYAAIEEFEKALQLDPSFWLAKKSIEFLKEYIKKKHISFGGLYESEKKWHDAIGEYRKALEVDPSSWRIHKKMAHAFHKLRQHKKATAHIKKAIELSESNALLHLSLGILYDAQGDYEAAREAYTRALSFSPHHKEMSKQKKLSEKICSLIPKKKGIHTSSLTIIESAALFIKKGMPDVAITILKKGIKKFPNDQDIYCMLGNVYYAIHKYKFAIRFYKKACALPHTISKEEILYNMGLAFASDKKWKEAIHVWETCIKNSPKSRAGLRAKMNLDLIRKKRL